METIGAYTFDRAQENRVTLHQHQNDLEILVVLNGQQHYRLGHQDLILHGRQFLIIPPGISHDAGTGPYERGEVLWMNISKPHDSDSWLGLSKSIANTIWEQLLHAPGTANTVPLPLHKSISIVHRSIIDCEATRSNVFATTNLTSIRLLHIIHELLIFACQPIDEIDSDTPDLSEIITSHLDKTDDISHFAHIAGISRAHFNRLFRRQTGMSPKDFIVRLKIDAAKKMLGDACPIIQIAQQLHFSSSQHFSATFKRIAGLTPSAFRKMIR